MNVSELHPPTQNAGTVLIIVVASYLMIVVDISIVITGLPQIQANLGFSAAQLSWVTNAYTLAFGGLLLLGARAGDILGRRRMFIAGLSLFTLASAAIGVGQSAAWLLAARAVQGAGAAVLAPSTLALLSTHFPEGPARTRALSLYAAAAGVGATLGLVLGGFFADLVSWRAGFFINLPIGLVLIAAARRHIAETAKRPGRFDLSGAASSTLGMTALVFGLVRAAEAGWRDELAGAALAGGVLMVVAFVWIERRAGHPVLPLRLLAHRERAGAYATRMLFMAGAVGFWFFSTQFLQGVLHLRPLQAGLAFLPVTLPNFASAMAVPRLARRYGSDTLLLAGLLLGVAGLAWLGQAEAHASYWLNIAPPMALIGLGQGLLLGPLTASGVAGVTREDAGAASGLVNVAHQLGGALGPGCAGVGLCRRGAGQCARHRSPCASNLGGHGHGRAAAGAGAAGVLGLHRGPAPPPPVTSTGDARMKALLCLALGGAATVAGAQTPASAAAAPTVAVRTAASTPVATGANETFTGVVYIGSQFQAQPPGRAGGATVSFEARARTAWHTHPLGQTLVVTAGLGLVQQQGQPAQVIRPGDVVTIPANVRHWHGAGPDGSMTHVAIAEKEDGSSVTWQDKVTDQDYQAALSSAGLALGTLAMTHAQPTSGTLSAKQQAIPLMASFLATSDMPKLNAALNRALDAGMTISEAKEVLVQLYAYAGFPKSLNALAELLKVVEARKQRGIQDAPGREPIRAMATGNELIAAGKANQTEISGAPVQGPLFDFAPVINQFLQAHLFGDIFERDNLDWQSRELATVGALAAMPGVEAQLRSHMRASLRVGLSAAQLRQLAQVLADGGDQEAASRANEALTQALAAASKS